MTGTTVHIPTLATDRLTLGAFSMAHFEAFAAFSATERSKYFGGPTSDPRDAWDSCMCHNGQWIARGYGGLWVSETATGRPVGRVSIWHPINFAEPELSWAVYDGFERTGMATEAVVALRRWAFIEKGLGPLMSLIAPDNHRSIALAERLGCTQEARQAAPGRPEVIRFRHPDPKGGA